MLNGQYSIFKALRNFQTSTNSNFETVLEENSIAFVVMRWMDKDVATCTHYK